MARKDVNLVVRAKDETSKAFSNIGKASEALIAGFADIAKDGKSAQSTVGLLGKALGDLDRTLKGLTGTDKLKDNLREAGEALGRLKTESTDAASKLGQLDRAQSRIAASSDRLAAKAQGAATAIEKQGKAVDDAKAKSKGYEATLRESERELAKLETRQRNLPGQIEKATTALDKATARYDRYAAKVAETEKPSATLLGTLDKAALSVVKNTERLTGLTQSYNGVKAGIASLSVEVAKNAASFEKGNVAVERQAAIYDKIKANAAGLVKDLRAAGTAQAEIRKQFDAAAIGAAKAAAAVDKAAVEFDQIAVASGRAEAALVQFAGTGRATLTKATQQQGAALAETRRELDAQEAVVRNYAAALRATAQPTAQMVRDLTDARAASRVLRGEVDAQEAAFRGMSAVLRRTGADYAAIVAAQAKFRSLQGAAGGAIMAGRGAAGIGQGLEASRQAAARSAADLAKAREEAGKLAAEFQRIGPPTRESAAAMDAARSAVNAHKLAMEANLRAAGQLAAIYDRARAGTISLAQAERQAQSVAAGRQSTLARIRAETVTLAAAEDRVASSARSGGSAHRKWASDTDSLANSFRRLLGEQRQSLSMAGRIRAQVVQLTTAYVGLFGVIGGIQRTIKAFNTLETATARLSVVTKGDQSKTAQELDFVRRTADRLKISFETLADEYGKFAIATQGTNLEGAQTRKIFTSVAEAARVMKLDTEQVKGVMVALSQMVSKGTVSMEELRQQLGDRLPGAMHLMAAGLGYTTATMGDFIKAVSEGKISSDALIGFAEELDKKFGPQLAASLKTSQAAFGEFSNLIYNAFLRLAQGGFMDAITRLVQEMNEQLQSAEFLSFVDRVSAGLAVLADALGVLVENIRLVVLAFTALFAVRIAGWLTAAAVAFAGLYVRVYNTIGAYRLLAMVQREQAASSAVVTTAATRAAGAFRTLGIAMRALTTATVFGALFTAAAVAVSYFATSADKGTEALERHNDIVATVKNAWDKSGGSIDKFRAALDGLTVSQLNDNLLDMKERLADIRESTNSTIISMVELRARMSALNVFTGTAAARSQYEELVRLRNEFAKNEIASQDFKVALDQIAQAAETDAIREFAVSLQAKADAAIEAEKGVKQAEAALKAKTGTTEEATKAVNDLTGAVDENAISMGVKAAAAAEKFKKALEEVKKFIPELKAELDDLADMKDLQLAVDGLGMGPYTKEQQELIERATGATAIKGDFSKTADAAIKAKDGVEAAAAVMRFFEGFIPYAKWDKNAYRTGFGSDTTTDSSGRVSKVTPGTRTTVEDANRDLYRRLGQFMDTVRRQIGGDTFNAFNPAQQAVLTSIAYNYGSLPERLVKAIKTGDNAEIVRTIQRMGHDNPEDGKPNMRRRNQEAGLFDRAARPSREDVEDQIERQEKADEKQAKEDERKAERAEEYNTLREQRIAQLEGEAEGEGRLTREQTIQKAIDDERNKARKAGVELDAESVRRITEATGKEYDRLAAIRAEKGEKEALQKAEQELANLETQRTELLNQRKLAQEGGDQSGVKRIDAEIVELNAKLVAAIENMKALYRETGGSAADAGIAKLNTLNAEIDKQAKGAKTVILNWQSVGELFGNGLVNAFDSFAKAVAEGKSVTEAARDAFLQFASDFLRQIAQMILKQLVFNAITGFFPGFNAGVSHAGGMAGRSNRSRNVDPSIFANAPRFHSGGVPGLKSNEIPAILEEGEEVLSKDSPRNIMNGGAGVGGAGAAPAAPANLKVVNMFDGGSFLAEGLATVEGEQALLNFVRSNKSAFKGAMS